jgi:hypothetical protein
VRIKRVRGGDYEKGTSQKPCYPKNDLLTKRNKCAIIKNGANIQEKRDNNGVDSEAGFVKNRCEFCECCE